MVHWSLSSGMLFIIFSRDHPHVIRGEFCHDQTFILFIGEHQSDAPSVVGGGETFAFELVEEHIVDANTKSCHTGLLALLYTESGKVSSKTGRGFLPSQRGVATRGLAPPAGQVSESPWWPAEQSALPYYIQWGVSMQAGLRTAARERGFLACEVHPGR